MAVFDDIWDEVNARVAERLPAVILDKAAARHTNNNLGYADDGCTCEYCNLRRRMSAYVGSAGRNIALPPGVSVSYPMSRETISMAIKISREYRREEARKALREARAR